MKLLIYILILISQIMPLFATSKFIMEGNISRSGNLLQITKTQNPYRFIALSDTNNDGKADDMILLLADTANSSKYIENISLSAQVNIIKGNYFGPVIFNKLIKTKGVNDQYVLVGSYRNATASAVFFNTYGFVVTFDYVPLAVSPFLNRRFQQFPEHNVSNIRDVVERNETNNITFILTGSSYNHLAIGSFNTVATGVVTVLNKYEDLAWIAEVDTALALKRHYVNEFVIEESHDMLKSELDKLDGVVSMGTVGPNDNLLMFDLNTTQIDQSVSTLIMIQHYTTYTVALPGLTVGTSIDKGIDLYKGRYLEEAASVAVSYTDGLTPTFVIPGNLPTTPPTPVDFPYTLNATADIRTVFEGYDATTDEAWDYLDINCSDTAGLSRDVNATYIIPFPVAKIPIGCQPPAFNFYESDKNIAGINLQWEWIYEKKAPLYWDKVHTDVDGVLDTSSMTINEHYLGSDNNNSAISVLRNTNGAKQFNILQINTIDGDTISNNHHPKTQKTTSITLGRSLISDQDGNIVFVGEVVEDDKINAQTNCIVMKVDKQGNEIWEQYFGGYWNDGCVAIVSSNTTRKPTYNEYLAVGSTVSTTGNNGRQGWAINFRDSGSLINLNYQWNLIGNTVDRNISGFKAINGTSGLNTSTSLGSYKYYLLFKDNQWLLNKTPIEPLDGFFIVSYDNSQKIFLEGDLVEQKFQEIQDGETGWTLLTTGVKLLNPKVVYDLFALYVYRNAQYQANPIEIFEGEGFWAKKYR